MNGDEENGAADPDTATLSKKFSFFEKGGGDNPKKDSEPAVSSERLHAAKECKASSVINKFKDLEKRAANGEDDYGRAHLFYALVRLKLSYDFL